MAGPDSVQSDSVQIIAPEPERHLDDISHLVAMTFGDYWLRRERYRTGYFVDSAYDWDTSRIAYIGDTLVGHFGVFAMTLRFGRARLRVAGVGAVACHAEYRRRGIVRELTTAAREQMAAAGYHASLLYGIPDFYHRFGYVTAWPELYWKAQACDLPADAPQTEEITDWTELAECFNRWHEAVPGTAVRPTFLSNPRPHKQSGRLWRAGDGSVAGYLVSGPSEGALLVTDIAGEPETALAVTRRTAAEAWCPTVVLETMPPASPYVDALRRRKHRLLAEAEPNGGPMARVVSLRQSLEELKPEFPRRLRSLGILRPVRLTLSDGRECCLIEAAADGPARIEPVTTTGTGGPAPRLGPHLDAGDALIRLLFGTHTIDELLSEGSAGADDEAAAAARALFPKLDPSLPSWDRV